MKHNFHWVPIRSLEVDPERNTQPDGGEGHAQNAPQPPPFVEWFSNRRIIVCCMPQTSNGIGPIAYRT